MAITDSARSVGTEFKRINTSLISNWMILMTGCVILFIYWQTMYRTMPGGDAGELVAEGCHLGVAHPPGYPLFILLTYLVTQCTNFVSVNPATKSNMLCAVLSTGAALFIMASVGRLAARPSKSNWARKLVINSAGMLAAICYACSPLIWTYAIGSEVFALNNFFAALLVWETIWCFQSRNQEEANFRLLIGALSCGLALCNQHTIILFEVPLISFLLFHHKKIIHKEQFVSCLIAFFVGLSPYLYLFVAHNFFRRSGSWGDTSTIVGLFHHFRRADYGTLQLYARDAPTAEKMVARTVKYIEDVITVQLPPFLWTIALVSVVVTILSSITLLQKTSGSQKSRRHRSSAPRNKRKLDNAQHLTEKTHSSSTNNTRKSSMMVVTAAILVTWVFYVCVFHSLSNMPMKEPLLFGVHARFWQQPNVAVCVFVGLGLILLFDMLTKSPHPKNDENATSTGLNRTEKEASQTTETSTNSLDTNFDHHTTDQAMPSSSRVEWFLSVTCVLFCICVCIFQIESHWKDVNMRENDVMDQYGRAILDPLPRNAILITSYDMQWTATRYLTVCEGYRSDVSVFNSAILSFKWYEAQRHTYKNVTFPGYHLMKAMTEPHAQGAFSMRDFMEANVPYASPIVDVSNHPGFQSNSEVVTASFEYMGAIGLQGPENEFTDYLSIAQTGKLNRNANLLFEDSDLDAGDVLKAIDSESASFPEDDLIESEVDADGTSIILNNTDDKEQKIKSEKTKSKKKLQKETEPAKSNNTLNDPNSSKLVPIDEDEFIVPKIESRLDELIPQTVRTIAFHVGRISFQQVKPQSLQMRIEGVSWREFPSSSVFLAGELGFNDDDAKQSFELIPYGLAFLVVRKRHVATMKQRHELLEESLRSYKFVQSIYSPPQTKEPPYDQSTWEYTTRVDFWMKTHSLASAVLDAALSEDDNLSPRSTRLAFRAIYLLEQCIAEIDARNVDPLSVNVLKAAGLGYARLIKSSTPLPVDEILYDPLAWKTSGDINEETWRKHAGWRVVQLWSRFLHHPDSYKDPGRDTIANIVRSISLAMQGKRGKRPTI